MGGGAGAGAGRSGSDCGNGAGGGAITLAAAEPPPTILQGLPEAAQSTARDGLAQGLAVAAQSPPPIAGALRDNVSDAFMSGLHAGCLTAAAVCLAGALFVLAFLPAHPAKAELA